MTRQPLWIDCELRILEAIDAVYRVELILNGEQVFRGAADAALAAWTPTGDSVADGQTFFALLLRDTELLKAWGEARGRSKSRRIRVRIDPLTLHALPWELLRDADDILAAQADTPFSRYLPTDQPWGGAIAARPIRVLAVIANPSDLAHKYSLPPADVPTETSTLREALAPLSQPGREGESVSLTFLAAPVTMSRLEDELQKGYHVLHFIGHGAFNEKKQQAALYVQHADGTANRVIDDDFVGMLNRLAAPPQLIVLAACHSAVQAQTQAFSGLGPKLVQIGIPAVVAMQDKITVLTARQFGAKFYRRLLAHGTVDLAMNEARSTLITNGRYDAAVPVLFMRLRDGRLWSDRAQHTEAQAAVQPIEPPPPIGRTTLSKADRESLERQLASLRENLLVIEELIAKYVQETEVPLQYLAEERRLRKRIAELEQKLSGG